MAGIVCNTPHPRNDAPVAVLTSPRGTISTVALVPPPAGQAEGAERVQDLAARLLRGEGEK